MTVTLEPFGDAAWRLPLTDRSDPRALLERLRTIPRVRDAVVTEEHALVAFDPASPPARGAMEAALEDGGRATYAVPLPREHIVTVRYDGADLEEVARAVGATPLEVAAMHAAPLYVVSTVGFLPGFAYLRGLDERLVLPRRETPRARVPALAVAIAGPYSGVYPFASPGGWHLVGTAVGFSPFEARAGAALALGDRVRFVPERP